MSIEDMIRAIQEQLGITADGRAGPETWGAIYARIVPAAKPPPAQAEDSRSEKNIATLLPEVQPYARALIGKAAAVGITIKVISGTRSYAEQDALYAQGRSAPGPIVTNAKAGYSNHNFGLAFDIGVFEGNKYLAESPKYKAVGALGIEIGLSWGGSWKSFQDQPHFELRPAWAKNLSESQMLAALRQRKTDGEPVFA
ncbi:MAG TPA: M15 family metallopeptidase [Gammaproteobacteria bacterium]|nr:M15 family metallopeptidase [Gammaproteobacteria bacterium]